MEFKAMCVAGFTFSTDAYKVEKQNSLKLSASWGATAKAVK